MFDAGGCLGRLCSCLLWEGGTRCFVGDFIWDTVTESGTEKCFEEERFKKLEVAKDFDFIIV